MRPTTPPESADTEPAETPEPDDGPADGGDTTTTKPTRSTRRRRTRTDLSSDTKGRKLSLPDSVHFRLHLVALQRGKSASEVAAEILDRNLPKLRIEREE
jgi:hypothetical protein